jgi:leader peptidase (prepilin peptidase)/N-methyltransferase
MSFEQQLELFISGPFGVAFAGLWGALWGSFFNVVICRVPSGESLVKPPSHCRACGEQVRWYDNVPIVSYLWLRGRCRHCGAGYSARYLLVELLVAGLAVAMHQVFVTHGSGDIALRAAQLVITSLFCGLLVAISFIDYDTRLIPNVITYPAIPICVLLSVFMGLPHLWDGPVGAVAGYALIWLIAEGYFRLRGREGMGLGDAKLMAMIGGLLGWQALYPVLLLGSLQGVVIAIPLLLLRRPRPDKAKDAAIAVNPDPPNPQEPDQEGAEDEDVEDLEDDPNAPLGQVRIPFGPFLCLAAIEVIVLRDVLPTLLPFLYG